MTWQKPCGAAESISIIGRFLDQKNEPWISLLRGRGWFGGFHTFLPPRGRNKTVLVVIESPGKATTVFRAEASEERR
jgi:hypothetical protein